VRFDNPKKRWEYAFIEAPAKMAERLKKIS